VDRVTSLKVVGFGLALVLSLLAAILVGIGLAPALVICTVAALVGYSAPNLYLHQKAYDRTEKLQKALPDALDLLTISVESGLGFDAALSQVARNTEGPLADELARVLQEMQIGMGRGAALRALGDRTKVDDVKGFVSAMVQADALGIPVAQVLRVQSREIRTKRRQRAEEQAQKVAIKILVPMIFCILPCLFIAVLGPAGLSMIEAFSGRF
jgi:tight adherence protein C